MILRGCRSALRSGGFIDRPASAAPTRPTGIPIRSAPPHVGRASDDILLEMSVSRSVIVNARSLTARLTGVQRYTTELLRHFPLNIEKVSPPSPMQGMKGH